MAFGIATETIGQTAILDHNEQAENMSRLGRHYSIGSGLLVYAIERFSRHPGGGAAQSDNTARLPDPDFYSRQKTVYGHTLFPAGNAVA